MTQQLNIQTFLELKKQHPVFDVRTPKEFETGHIPGAYNLPLFSNEERAIVGTIYKKEGKEQAVLKGLEFVGPKLRQFIEEVQKITDQKEIIFHCWRGGMRSSSMAWLFETAGYSCSTLSGGYKSYRGALRKELDTPSKIIILGGMTGSGKTEILSQLAAAGEQVLDLEKLAHHKGSSFGAIGENPQPSTEQFGNNIFEIWHTLDKNRPIWIEDESHSVGRCFVPEELWKQMRISPVIKLEVSFDERIERLIRSYTVEDKSALIEATERIRKRLGGQHVKAAIEAIEAGNYREAATTILKYYDKAYLHGLSKRKQELVSTFNYTSPNAFNDLIKKAEEILD